jgi:hypothetical protein
VAPDGVVLDGLLQNAAASVIDGIMDVMHRSAPPAVVSQLQVVAGMLGDKAELQGAATLARHNQLT